MVRPKAKEPKHQFSVMLRPSLVDEIDILAEKYNMTRSQLMGNLIETGLDDMKLYDKFGFLKAIVFGDKIMKKFKESLVTGKVSLNEKGDLEIKK